MPRDAEGCQGTPRVAKGFQGIATAATGCQVLPKTSRGLQGFTTQIIVLRWKHSVDKYWRGFMAASGLAKLIMLGWHVHAQLAGERARVSSAAGSVAVHVMRCVPKCCCVLGVGLSMVLTTYSEPTPILTML